MLLVLLTARALRLDPPQTVVIPGLEYALPGLCTFRQLFGVDCPGCGMTRSFILTARLRLGDAWQLNPAGTLLCSSLALSLPWRLAQWSWARSGKPVPPSLGIEIGWLILLALVMMVCWGWRTFA